jgi:hypothetical protein
LPAGAEHPPRLSKCTKSFLTLGEVIERAEQEYHVDRGVALLESPSVSRSAVRDFPACAAASFQPPPARLECEDVPVASVWRLSSTYFVIAPPRADVLRQPKSPVGP